MKHHILLFALGLSSVALAQPRVPPAPPMAPVAPTPPPTPMRLGDGLFAAPGIPPAVAQRLGISNEVVKRVKDASFDANDQLIQFEADLKRAQLELQRALAAASPDEGAVLAKLEKVNAAELSVRKNRMGLMLRIRSLVGAATWEKLQAELGEDSMVTGPGGVRREVRVIRRVNGQGETVTEDIQGP